MQLNKFRAGMDIIKCSKYLFFLFILSFSAKGQDVLKLSREECEAVFLEKNLLLMAEKMQISQAEAAVLQARLWPNPTFEIDEVNLWASEKQLAVFGDELQGFNGGDFGKNQQLGFSFEQLIFTAGKRRKSVELEQVSVDKSKQYFENLLRNLKTEFRNQLTQLQYLQFNREIYQNQLTSIKQLTQAYQRQVEFGNIGRDEFIRLKALELEMAKNINELNAQINASQKELKLLMRLPSTTQLEITEEGYLKDLQQLEAWGLEELIARAKENRPDLRIAQLDQNYYDRLFAYEKAQRVPDLTLKVGYDRGGNFMYNFVGFGLAIDLPFFNRNQGNIKYAQIGREHSDLLFQQANLEVESEIVLAYQNLLNAAAFVDEIEPDYESVLDQLLESYTKNFSDRNISMLEYLDFLDAYLENKKIILEAGKEVNEKVEELNYSVGTDLFK